MHTLYTSTRENHESSLSFSDNFGIFRENLWLRKQKRLKDLNAIEIFQVEISYDLDKNNIQSILQSFNLHYLNFEEYTSLSLFDTTYLAWEKWL